eukprot:4650741-Amphidinium_carterae.1
MYIRCQDVLHPVPESTPSAPSPGVTDKKSTKLKLFRVCPRSMTFMTPYKNSYHRLRAPEAPQNRK